MNFLQLKMLIKQIFDKFAIDSNVDNFTNLQIEINAKAYDNLKKRYVIKDYSDYTDIIKFPYICAYVIFDHKYYGVVASLFEFRPNEIDKLDIDLRAFLKFSLERRM